MQTIAQVLTALSDDELLRDVKTRALHEREVTAQIIAALAEIDARQLHLALRFNSLFDYCTSCLHFTEHEAYDRMKVARAVRQWPLLLELLADGSLTVTAVRLLAPHLTVANHEAVLRAATHKRIREVEEQVAALRPLPDVSATVRKIPARRDGRTTKREAQKLPETPVASDVVAGRAITVQPPEPAPAGLAVANRAIVAPLAPERYRIQFSIGRETRDKLRRVQDLLRHAVPDGDPAIVFDRALTVLLADLEKKKFAQVEHPQHARATDSTSRHVPAAVKREVWKRDVGRCAFVGSEGRCTETGFLEFHHVEPYADGGPTVASNLQLRCRAHNAYEGFLHFGSAYVREAQPPYGLTAMCGMRATRWMTEQGPSSF